MEHRVAWLDPIFVGLSFFASYGLWWIALAALLAWVTNRPPRFPVLLSATSVWTAELCALGLKLAIGRPRPSRTIPEADPLMGALGYSMPSGHAATAFAGAVVLTFLWRRFAPLFFLLAAAIAFSRVYVGVHYPSDVLAGAALGAAVGLFLIAVLRLPRRRAADPLRSGARPPGS